MSTTPTPVTVEQLIADLSARVSKLESESSTYVTSPTIEKIEAVIKQFLGHESVIEEILRGKNG
jgi:hypothetical protein